MSDKPAEPRALRDSALYFGAQLGARALNFVYFLILTQTLPVDEFGVLNYALSIIILLDILVDLGLSRHAMREISKDHGLGGAFIKRILPYKLAASTLVFAGFCLIISLSDQAPIYKTINILAALGLFFTSPAMLFENVLQAHHRFSLISFAHIALSVLQFAVGGVILWLGGSTVLISLTFALTYFTYAGIVGWGVWKLRLDFPPRADFPELLRSVPSSFPYLVSALVIMFAIRAEFVILGYFGTKENLAVFGMATKIIEASLLMPLAFSTVMSPRFSNAHGKSTQVLSRVYAGGLEMILLLAIPTTLISMALVPLAQYILGYGDYGEVGAILYITFLGYPAASVFTYNTAALFGAVRQFRPLVILTSLGLLQVAINIGFQSAYGMTGAAIAFVVFMYVAALFTTVSIVLLYARGAALWSAFAAPLAGAVLAGSVLAIFGVSTLSLVAALLLCCGASWGVRLAFPARVTSLELNPDAEPA